MHHDDPAHRLRIRRGDATNPATDGPAIIVHLCNDAGRWGKGFVLGVSRRWHEPEQAYRRWHRAGITAGFQLGAVQLVKVQEQPARWVANLIAQHDTRRHGAGPPIRYDALACCLHTLAGHARALDASVHMPRLGCGLAGGRWDLVEPLITQTLLANGITTTVYDYP